jgi:hypothetical protein
LNQLSSLFTPSIDTPQFIFDFFVLFILTIAPKPAFEKFVTFVLLAAGATAID